MQDFDKNGKPIIDEIYLRPSNAEILMESAYDVNQTVYISGATGYGKTSFVSDYLKSKEYEYFSALNIDELINGLNNVLDIVKESEPDKKIIVIDDLHYADTQEVRDVLYDILYELTGLNNVFVILISRAEIPSWIKPLYIKRFFVLINENHLGFTKKEQHIYYIWRNGILNLCRQLLINCGKVEKDIHYYYE